MRSRSDTTQSRYFLSRAPSRIPALPPMDMCDLSNLRCRDALGSRKRAPDLRLLRQYVSARALAGSRAPACIAGPLVRFSNAVPSGLTPLSLVMPEILLGVFGALEGWL